VRGSGEVHDRVPRENCYCTFSTVSVVSKMPAKEVADLSMIVETLHLDPGGPLIVNRH